MSLKIELEDPKYCDGCVHIEENATDDRLYCSRNFKKYGFLEEDSKYRFPRPQSCILDNGE